MRKILLPVDGSETSERAVKLVIGQVKGREPAEIHLVNVQLPIRADELGLPGMREAIQQVHDEAGAKALRNAKQLLDAAGLAYTGRILVDEPAPAIARYAKEQGCESIVMGTRGMGAIGGLLVGSVATKVIHLAEVPVTLVK